MVEWNQRTASSNRQTRQRFGGEWMTENDGDTFQMSDWVHQLPSSMLHSSQQNVTFSQRHERKGNSFANGWIFQPNMLGHQKGVHCCDLMWCDVSQNCAGVAKIQHRWCGGSGLGTLESYNQNWSCPKVAKIFLVLRFRKWNTSRFAYLISKCSFHIYCVYIVDVLFQCVLHLQYSGHPVVQAQVVEGLVSTDFPLDGDRRYEVFLQTQESASLEGSHWIWGA